jgi:dephospho-CoA kinase
MAGVTGGDYRGQVKRIVIAGGIGAGKTVVTDRLLELNWTVVDSDLIAHQVTAAGRPAWRALRDAFGDAVLTSGGELDRPFVADIVFHDPSALRRLNNITHGYIGAEIIAQLDVAPGAAAFISLPLFQSEHRDVFSVDEVWAVQVRPETAVRRLCEYRGFTESDARARLSVQMTNEERTAIVDRVMWNEGSIDDLYVQLDALLHGAGLGRG